MDRTILIFFVFAAAAGLLLTAVRNAFKCRACGGWKSSIRHVEEEAGNDEAGDILQLSNSSTITRERVCTGCDAVISSRKPRQ